MEKISGIIPSSSRVASVDMKEAPPVRPGTPGFGRAEGVSALREQTMNGGNTAQRSSGIQAEHLDWRSKDLQHANVAKQVSDRFFAKNKQTADEVSDVESSSMNRGLQVSANSRPAGFKTDEVGSFRATSNRYAASEENEEPGPQLAQPEGLFPKGSFLDRTV